MKMIKRTNRKIMKKPKVLMVSPPPSGNGGIARWSGHIIDYHNSLKKNSLRIDFSFFPMGRRKFITATTTFPVKIKEGIIDYLKLLLLYRKVLKKENPSLVHLVSSASLGLIKDIIIILINRNRGIKTVLHFRFGRIPELARLKNWEWKMLSWVIKKSNKVIVIDLPSYNTLIDNNFVNIEYVPNPIAPKILSFVEKYAAIQREERKIVFAGHTLPSKGVFELLNVCTRIPNIQLVMMGKLIPGIKEKLMKIANVKDNTDWIRIIGEQETEIVVKEMLTCSVFVLPSYTEAFPNVILESMACSCPIVATSVGAIPEMLNISNPEFICGTCVEVKNTENLKIAIEKYLNNRKLAEIHGNNARKRVVCEYNISGIWGQLTRIWNETTESYKM